MSSETILVINFMFINNYSSLKYTFALILFLDGKICAHT